MANAVTSRAALTWGALLLAATAIGVFFLLARGSSPGQGSASQAGLTVQTGRDDDIRLDPKRPIRCFVAGKMVGELRLGECARRNGVQSGALDVGLDPSGALAASNGSAGAVTPLQAAQPTSPSAPASPDQAVAEGPVADNVSAPPHGSPESCWRYAGGAWNVLSRPMGLGACVQSLYDGECQHSGGVAYGRWGDRTLRLVAGRVEISRDNHVFRTLVEQGPGCAVPNLD